MKKLVSFLLLLCLAACSPRVYVARNFRETVQPRHKVVAILPFAVHIKPAPSFSRAPQPPLAEQEQQAAAAIQNSIYSYLLQRESKNQYTVTFQDVSKTNALLQQAGLSYEDLQQKPREEIARLLGVDAVLSGQMLLSKPLPLAAAVAINMLTSFYVPSDEVTASLSIHDNADGQLLWKYDCNLSGGGGTVALGSAQSLTNSLMRNASKRFPYQRKS